MTSKTPLQQATNDSDGNICIGGQIILPRSMYGDCWIAPGQQRIYSIETAKKVAVRIFAARAPRAKKAKAAA